MLVVLVLLAIVIAYACGNVRTLNALKRQMGLIEMRQTNSPAYWRAGAGAGQTSLNPEPANRHE